MIAHVTLKDVLIEIASVLKIQRPLTAENQVGSVPFVLEMDEVDQKDCPQKECFGRGGPVAGKRDTEVVGIGEGLLGQSTPFFGDLALFHVILHDLKRPGFQ